ncbi:DUF3099 domain-containing protein [Kineosporia sp. NBRC 101731]|uniref:DUF3099 domain-containing protein n=1 Tax=Kineosporia sp. NBRC 101731 TaxID=3032199 RepID=UPI002556F1D5|nr:DUF3099 domain-containing protein [Kineosporia sp. NBRC 101731]
MSPLSDDLDARIRRYLISMSMRVVCVILAIVVHTRWGHWSWWIFAIGAVFLPYVAVVMANATDRRGGPGPAPVTPVTPSVRTALSSAAPAATVDEDIEVTIHPPQRPFHEESSGSEAFEGSFDASRANGREFVRDSTLPSDRPQ